MRLRKFDSKEKSLYQEFVRGNCSFVQDWDWGDFQELRGAEVLRYCLEENGKILAASQFIRHGAAGKNYLHAPYGPVLNPELLADRPAAASVLDIFASELLRAEKNLLFFRIEPQFQISEMKFSGKLLKTTDINPHQTLLLDLQKNEDEILAQMHQKTRYNIKLGEKQGIKIKIENYFSAESQSVFSETARRSKIKLYPRSYYAAMLKNFSGGDKSISAKMYVASHEQEVLASCLVVYYGYTAFYLFGGSSERNKNFKASHFMQWRAITDARSAGLRKYDFWGIEDSPGHSWSGFSRFKAGFGGRVVQYAGTYDYVLTPAWYNIYIAFRKLNKFIRK